MGAAGAAMVGGGALQAYGALKEGDATAEALMSEADTAARNAVFARKTALYNASKQAIESAKVIGAAEAGYAASGVSATSGSVLEVLRESHTNAALDYQQIIKAGEERAGNYSAMAETLRRRADNAKSAGKIKAFTSLFSAGLSAYGAGG